jgi:hypothetical protein
MDINVEIKVGKVLHNKKERECYIPMINGKSVLSENTYILKDSINEYNGVKTDNYNIAVMFLNNEVNKLNNSINIVNKYRYD